ncbi:YggT family protein [Enemella evansiae]|uniref:YggT family protein n=1 Tax=Enemella evansiae TaxID=2016499 RepID=A0A255GGH8_9ACTN|nr:YggT family protein [Enemella evansiae]PFG67901.1 YggT family protein [Propionibacteriaceae bacterium ES.041]OYN93068.1 YggT family protein [Enemella evansiae]OYN95887.1 YggT family protein [Enemella evansiae]OYO04095.1 YggT family protein [Enemella evansiae]OYO08567.1 YggT family protein [Enemella evansiae]
MVLIGQIIDFILWAYIIVLFARMVLSWVPLFAPDWRPKGPLLVVAEAIYTVTDPPLRALRRVIPPVRMGNVMLDLGFMVLWLLIIVLRSVNARIFFA